LLAVLRPGKIRIDYPASHKRGNTESKHELMVVLGGYMEVQPEAVIILADAVERAEDLNEALAKDAMKKAKLMLKSSDKEKVSRAHLELELAMAKLTVLRKNKQYAKR